LLIFDTHLAVMQVLLIEEPVVEGVACQSPPAPIVRHAAYRAD